MRLCSLSPRLSELISADSCDILFASNFPRILSMPSTAESCFGLMSDFPLLDFLKGLATLATKLDFLWTSIAGMDTMLVTAMLVQLEEGLPALSVLSSELDLLGKRMELHMLLDSSNFVEMHLLPG